MLEWLWGCSSLAAGGAHHPGTDRHWPFDGVSRRPSPRNPSLVLVPRQFVFTRHRPSRVKWGISEAD